MLHFALTKNPVTKYKLGKSEMWNMVNIPGWVDVPWNLSSLYHDHSPETRSKHVLIWYCIWACI